jgi:hypothetical protein
MINLQIKIDLGKNIKNFIIKNEEIIFICKIENTF